MSDPSRSRNNLHNVVHTRRLIEQLLDETRFGAKDVTIATPYRAQVRAYRQAFEVASRPYFWRDRSIFAVKASTIDSL